MTVTMTAVSATATGCREDIVANASSTAKLRMYWCATH